MIKAFFKNAITFIIGILVCILILIYINEDFGLFCFIILILIYILRGAIWARESINNSEINSNLEFVKVQPKRHYNLFTWLGEEKSSDRIIYELIGNVIEKPTTIETLKELKKLIEIKLNGDLIDYHLVREMIKSSRKESFAEFLRNSIAVGSIGVAIISGIIKEGYIKKFIDFLGLNDLNLLVSILIGGIYFLLLLIVISTFYTIMSKPKRRANIVLMILDEIIKEKETNNNNP